MKELRKEHSSENMSIHAEILEKVQTLNDMKKFKKRKIIITTPK